MKKTLLIVLFITGVCFGQTYQLAEEFYENGLPKVIKTYKVSKGKIEIVKEVGWHKNGQKKSEGTYKDGIKDGKWIHSTDIGNGKYEVKYTKGNIDLATFTDNLGQTYSGIPVKGELKADGQYLYQEHEYNFSKYPEFFATIKNGKEDGLVTAWYENGQKRQEGTAKDGEKDGLWTEWHKNGQKEYEVTYKYGEFDGLFSEWYENGQKRMERPFKDGQTDGLWTWWHKNGQKEREETYKDGEPDGKWTEWHENGQMRMETTWKVGEMISIKCWDENGDDDNCGEPILAALSLVQAKQLFDDGILFVDARDDAYYSKGHIQGAMKNAFLMELIFNIEARQSKAEPLVIYSSDPDNGDSEDLAYDLQDLGFTKLYVFKGGWLEWSKAGYPTK